MNIFHLHQARAWAGVVGAMRGDGGKPSACPAVNAPNAATPGSSLLFFGGKHTARLGVVRRMTAPKRPAHCRSNPASLTPGNSAWPSPRFERPLPPNRPSESSGHASLSHRPVAATFRLRRNAQDSICAFGGYAGGTPGPRGTHATCFRSNASGSDSPVQPRCTTFSTADHLITDN
jgi:hypothetical protein